MQRCALRYFKTSPEIIRLAVTMHVRLPLSPRNVEDLLHERGIDVGDETIRFWWRRFGPMFAAEIRRKRVEQRRAFPSWRCHVGESFVKIDGERHCLRRAVHPSVDNHFSRERRLSGGHDFKRNRAVARAEWRQPGAARSHRSHANCAWFALV